jgi:hypothetical protein
LRLAWEATAPDALEAPPADRRPQPRLEAQFAVLVTCRDEAQQVELLRRFHAEGLECKALLSSLLVKCRSTGQTAGRSLGRDNEARYNRRHEGQIRFCRARPAR